MILLIDIPTKRSAMLCAIELDPRRRRDDMRLLEKPREKLQREQNIAPFLS
jgi:hypothetical protein